MYTQFNIKYNGKFYFNVEEELELLLNMATYDLNCNLTDKISVETKSGIPNKDTKSILNH